MMKKIILLMFFIIYSILVLNLYSAYDLKAIKKNDILKNYFLKEDVYVYFVLDYNCFFETNGDNKF